MAGAKGYKKQPNEWPTAKFMLIKIFTALFALIVFAIMAFFTYHLKADHRPVPWQFISIAAVSIATVFYVFALGVLFCCRALNPKVAMFVDCFFGLLWAFAIAILIRGMRGNLTRSCNTWGAKEGEVVCHLFKTIFSFTVLTWFGCFLSGILSATVSKRKNTHKYIPANPNSLQQKTAYAPNAGIPAGKADAPYGAGGTYKPQDKIGANASYYS